MMRTSVPVRTIAFLAFSAGALAHGFPFGSPNGFPIWLVGGLRTLTYFSFGMFLATTWMRIQR